MKADLQTVEMTIALLRRIKEVNRTESNLEAVRILFMMAIQLIGHRVSYPAHFYKGDFNILVSIDEEEQP